MHHSWLLYQATLAMRNSPLRSNITSVNTLLPFPILSLLSHGTLGHSFSLSLTDSIGLLWGYKGEEGTIPQRLGKIQMKKIVDVASHSHSVTKLTQSVPVSNSTSFRAAICKLGNLPCQYTPDTRIFCPLKVECYLTYITFWMQAWSALADSRVIVYH